MAVPWVQGTAVLAANATTMAVVTPSAVGTGDLLCVVYGWNSQTGTGSISDNFGNTYTSLLPTIFGTGTWAAAYCTNAHAGTTTITLNKSGASATLVASVDEYAGTFSFFNSAVATATNVNPLNAVIATANTGDLIFGAGVSVAGLGIVAGPGFTQREAISNTLVTEDQFLVAGRIATASFTTNGNDNYIGFALDFFLAQPPPFGAPRYAITFRTW